MDETGKLCLTDHKCTDKTDYFCYTQNHCYTQDDCDTLDDCKTNIYCDTVDGCKTGVCDTVLTKCSPCFLSAKCEEESENCQETTRKCGDTVSQHLYCCALTEDEDQCIIYTEECKNTEQCLLTSDNNCNTKAVKCIETFHNCGMHTNNDCYQTDECLITEDCEETKTCIATYVDGGCI